MEWLKIAFTALSVAMVIGMIALFLIPGTKETYRARQKENALFYLPLLGIGLIVAAIIILASR